MTFKSDLTYKEFEEKFSTDEQIRRFYGVNFKPGYVRIKRHGDRTFSMRGRVMESAPLKLGFTDTFSVRFAVVFMVLMAVIVIDGSLNIFAALSVTVSAMTALYVAGKVHGFETARVIINDFKLKLVLNKDKYYIAYNYFYYYLVIIFFLIYPAAVLFQSFKLSLDMSLIISVIVAVIVIAWLVLTRNFMELFIIDREGMTRQNIFVKKDKLVYSAADIESITVENKTLKGIDKDGAFSFAIKIKPEALYGKKGNFLRLKEEQIIYLPFNKVTSEIIKEKLDFDIEAAYYDEFYR
ncbi:MAG: hypothetical protein LBQ27_04170 [Clostridiales bacterium]|jgi:hypothetical protein|nr:hypothetical protein [Clostridiales bacterium]